jgi:hypothetical protein
VTREAHCQTEYPVKKSTWQKANAEQQQPGINAHRIPRERRWVVKSPGKPPSETFGRVCQTHREAARAMDSGVVRSVWPTVVPIVGGLLGEHVRFEGSGHQDGDA